MLACCAPRSPRRKENRLADAFFWLVLLARGRPEIVTEPSLLNHGECTGKSETPDIFSFWLRRSIDVEDTLQYTEYFFGVYSFGVFFSAADSTYLLTYGQ